MEMEIDNFYRNLDVRKLEYKVSFSYGGQKRYIIDHSGYTFTFSKYEDAINCIKNHVFYRENMEGIDGARIEVYVSGSTNFIPDYSLIVKYPFFNSVEDDEFSGWEKYDISKEKFIVGDKFFDKINSIVSEERINEIKQKEKFIKLEIENINALIEKYNKRNGKSFIGNFSININERGNFYLDLNFSGGNNLFVSGYLLNSVDYNRLNNFLGSIIWIVR